MDDDPENAGQCRQECSDSHESGWARRERYRRHDDGESCRSQSVRADGPFQKDPCQDRAEGDDRLGAQAVVVGHPDGEEHEARGPVGDFSSGDFWAEAWDDTP